MKSSEPTRWLERVAVENANERLNVDSEPCPLADRINALLIGASRCACGRCHLNRAIRRALLRESTRMSGSAERIPNFRFGPDVLAELAGAVKAGMCMLLGVGVVLAVPLVALEKVSSPKTGAAVTVAFHPPMALTRPATAITGAQNANVRPNSKQQSSVRRLETVPEVLNVARPAPPANLRFAVP